MGLKDKVVKALALRWARGKVKDLRGKERESSMGKVLKFLDGWKLVIAVIVMFGAGVYDQTANGHAGDIVGAVLAVLGWTTGAVGQGEITQAVASAVAIWAVVHKVIKAQRQVRVGSSVAGALSTEGYVSEYVADAMAGKAVVPVARVENDLKK